MLVRKLFTEASTKVVMSSVCTHAKMHWFFGENQTSKAKLDKPFDTFQLGGGFKLFVVFTPIMEEIIQCDLYIFFQGGGEKNHQLVWDESKIQSSIFVPQMLMTFFFSHWRMSKPLIPSDGCTAARLRHAEALTVTGFPQLGGRWQGGSLNYKFWRKQTKILVWGLGR